MSKKGGKEKARKPEKSSRNKRGGNLQKMEQNEMVQFLQEMALRDKILFLGMTVPRFEAKCLIPLAKSETCRSKILSEVKKKKC